MIESIGEMLTTRCAGVLPFYLSEAETESYPYAVYELTATEYRTKDGVYKYTAEPVIRVYDKDFDMAQAKVDLIRAALETPVDGQYVIRFRNCSKNCVDDVWNIELVYFVKQTS